MSRNLKTIEVTCPCGFVFMANRYAVEHGRGVYCSRPCLYVYRPVNHFQHGQTRHPLFSTWKSMVFRCTNPAAPTYGHYGGRGISVCESWLDVLQFIDWVSINLGPRPEGHSLDRIDNDGNYEPGNVRWATQAQQCANSRNPRAGKLLTPPLIMP